MQSSTFRSPARTGASMAVASMHCVQLGLAASVGLIDASIEYTHETGPGLHGATIRAWRP